MSVSAKKYLTIFIILLMVITPLQGVVASVDFELASIHSSYQMQPKNQAYMNLEQSVSMAHDNCMSSCQQHDCQTNNDCHTHECSNCQCGFSSVALLFEYPQLVSQFPYTVQPLTDGKVYAYLSSSLYRPPRL